MKVTVNGFKGVTASNIAVDNSMISELCPQLHKKYGGGLIATSIINSIASISMAVTMLL